MYQRRMTTGQCSSVSTSRSALTRVLGVWRGATGTPSLRHRIAPAVDEVYLATMLLIADSGRWCAALLFGLMLLLLLLIGAWLLRAFLPVVPTIRLSVVQPPAPTSPAGAPDPMPALKASLGDARNVEKSLKNELASRKDELRKRLQEANAEGESRENPASGNWPMRHGPIR